MCIKIAVFALWVSSFAAVLTIPRVHAQTAAPSPQADIHPFQSQTTIRSNGAGILNGMVQTLPAVTVGEYDYHAPGIRALQSVFNTGLLYDKRNPLGSTTVTGGNYTFYEGGYLSTVDANGTFLYKGKVDFQPLIRGGVYFTDRMSNQIVLVDSYGYFWNSFTTAPEIRLAGGNYYIDTAGVVTTFKSMGLSPGDGTGMMTVKTGMDFSGAKQAGGNFFVMADGTIVTVSSVNGFVSLPYTPDAKAKWIGGNYFVGEDSVLYTIDQAGNLKKNTDYPVSGAVLMGYSFLRFADGSFLFVDGAGMPHRSLIHVSSTGIQVENLTKLPVTIDMRSIYMPNSF